MNEIKKIISIISPCYNESKGIYECYNEIKKIFSKELINYNYEHIFCDNSSKDDSIKILREIAKKDKNVKVIINANNFGSQKSIWNSLNYTSGDAVVLFLPVDLQDPPELIIKFVRNWENVYDFVDPGLPSTNNVNPKTIVESAKSIINHTSKNSSLFKDFIF